MRPPRFDLAPIAQALILCACLAGFVTLVVTNHGEWAIWIVVMIMVLLL